jgi:hypothetical protein
MACLVRVGVGVTVLSIELKEHSSNSGRREGRCQEHTLGAPKEVLRYSSTALQQKLVPITTA